MVMIVRMVSMSNGDSYGDAADDDDNDDNSGGDAHDDHDEDVMVSQASVSGRSGF